MNENTSSAWQGEFRSELYTAKENGTCGKILNNRDLKLAVVDGRWALQRRGGYQRLHYNTEVKQSCDPKTSAIEYRIEGIGRFYGTRNTERNQLGW